MGRSLPALGAIRSVRLNIFSGNRPFQLRSADSFGCNFVAANLNFPSQVIGNSRRTVRRIVINSCAIAVAVNNLLLTAETIERWTFYYARSVRSIKRPR